MTTQSSQSLDGSNGAGDGLWPKPDGAHDPAGEAGWFLARERVLRGESPAEAAEAAKLPVEVVETIERGRLEEFASLDLLEKAISRYAGHLRFEPGPLIAHLRRLAAPQEGMAPGPVEVVTDDGVSEETDAVAMEADAGEPADDILPEAANDEPAPAIEPAGPGEAERAPDDRAEQIVAAARRFITQIDPAAVFRSLNERRPLAAGIGAGAGIIIGGLLLAVLMDLGGSGPIPEGATVTGTVDNMAGDAARSLAVPTVRIRERALDETAIADQPVSGDDADKLTALIRETGTGDGKPQEEAPAAAKSNADKIIVTGTVHGDTGKDVRIVLRASEGVWIRIENKKGDVVTTRTLSAGDSYRVPNRSGLVLAARNAGALQYVIDGKRRGRLGEAGDIVIGLPLDPDKLGRGG